MDLVYFVRRGENPELRFSLRSAAANLPHERVWIVGDKPSWVTGVQFIQGNRRGSKWLNVFDNLRIAAASVDVDRFVVMNDDFFVTRPVEEIPAWHRGPLTDHITRTRGEWNQSLVASLGFLRANGFPAPLSYELHVPVLMEREKLGAVLEAAAAVKGIPPQWRTLYGNWWHLPAERAPDVKVSRRKPFEPGTFFSTSDMTFASTAVGQWIRRHFPDPSPYERR